jgi:hypothetical protein
VAWPWYILALALHFSGISAFDQIEGCRIRLLGAVQNALWKGQNSGSLKEITVVCRMSAISGRMYLYLSISSLSFPTRIWRLVTGFGVSVEGSDWGKNPAVAHTGTARHTVGCHFTGGCVPCSSDGDGRSTRSSFAPFRTVG